MKLKTCSSCGIECYLWKSTPKLCKSCAVKNSMQIGSIKITTKSQAKIKQFSDKKLTELAIYRKLRDKYLSDYPVCQFKDCQSTNVELHHKKSRKYFLCDSESFMSVCRIHHNWIHENCAESYELSYLIKSI